MHCLKLVYSKNYFNPAEISVLRLFKMASNQTMSVPGLNNIVTQSLTLTHWPINSGVLTSLLFLHLSLSLTDSLPSLNLLCHSKTDARFMQDSRKAV